MTNREKFAGEIKYMRESTYDSVNIAVVNDKPEYCGAISCIACDLHLEPGSAGCPFTCVEALEMWLDSEYKDDSCDNIIGKIVDQLQNCTQLLAELKRKTEACDINKMIEQLQAEADVSDADASYPQYTVDLQTAINIIKAGGKEKKECQTK